MSESNNITLISIVEINIKSKIPIALFISKNIRFCDSLKYTIAVVTILYSRFNAE